MKPRTITCTPEQNELPNLKADRSVHIEANARAAIPTGITLKVPDSLLAVVETTPEMFYRKGLVSPCCPVVDGEEIMVLVWNPQPHRVNIVKNTVLAHVRIQIAPAVEYIHG